MNKLFIASNNKHKITEINEILKPAGGLMIYTSYKFGIRIDAEEDGNTLEENSFKKALKNYQVLNIPVISDDTGLFVDELNGEPGIFSARYAGIDSTYSENCSRLLSKMDTMKSEGKMDLVMIRCLFRKDMMRLLQSSVTQ